MSDALDHLKSVNFPDKEFIARLEDDPNLRKDLVTHFIIRFDVGGFVIALNRAPISPKAKQFYPF